MKNTFAVSMTLLLALTLGGSFAAYNIASRPHHEESHSEGEAVASEEAPSATSSATGAAGSAEAQGDAVAANEGGTQGGENGALAASGELTTPETPAASTEGTQADSTPSTQGSTGQEPAETAAAAETQGDATAGGKTYAVSCAGCHGANGQGQIGPSLVAADGPNSWTLAQFTTTLREGKTPERELGAVMPRFNETQLTDSDIANLQAFIKTLN
ncbi:c-type cytochrome [Deinococcus aquaticus]|uniref:Cytochrome c n=1 Tax=Deinococcus aquaticus TaxID=328692 RepID=A0ABY7UYZ3_9DEIO|nr:cytochrome c [Deinococcus aquaticus]WDA57740.1 cytochrome c [Deinococcus aquaticus]